jgi:hypothetical protein
MITAQRLANDPQLAAELRIDRGRLRVEEDLDSDREYLVNLHIADEVLAADPDDEDTETDVGGSD